MDAAKPLFQTVGVPREIVIDHKMRTLEVYAFSCGICRHKDADFLVLLEASFDLSTIITQHTAVDCNDSFRFSKECADFVS